jgi:HAD superfamily hydrolase (TIGR01509 family)
MIKAIFFDMDGVLVDAGSWHYESLNKALQPFGYEISLDDHYRLFDGLPTNEKLQMLKSEIGLSESDISTIKSEKQRHTFIVAEERCKPEKELLKLFDWIKGQSFKIAVCSNSIRRTVELIMTKKSLIHYFDIIKSNEDVVNPKPNKEMYCIAMSELNLLPSEVLIIEDSSFGIQAARASGAHVYIVQSPLDVNIENIKEEVSKINKVNTQY